MSCSTNMWRNFMKTPCHDCFAEVVFFIREVYLSQMEIIPVLLQQVLGDIERRENIDMKTRELIIRQFLQYLMTMDAGDLAKYFNYPDVRPYRELICEMCDQAQEDTCSSDGESSSDED